MGKITENFNGVIKYAAYKRHYTESAMWKKITTVFSKAGIKVTYMALVLYYLMKSPDVPATAKAKVVGALGYFILPLDLIPDWIPLLGFSDDLAALAWALKTVSGNITPAIRDQAAQQCHEWFGNFNPEIIAKLW